MIAKWGNIHCTCMTITTTGETSNTLVLLMLVSVSSLQHYMRKSWYFSFKYMYMSVSFQCRPLPLSPSSQSCSGCKLAYRPASAGIYSLASSSVVNPSPFSGPGCVPSPSLEDGGSLTVPAGNSPVDHLWASSADPNGTFLKWGVVRVMVLPSGLLATTPHAFPALYLQRLILVRGRGLVYRFLPD